MIALGEAATPVRPAALTLVLEFNGPHSDASVAAMKHELESLMKDTGVTLDWRTRSQAAGATFEHLVVVRFKGKCVLQPVAYLYDERGPLAFTHTSDGDVLPFTEVACDQVTASIRPVLSGGDFAHADLLLGRALGRVLAHELLHIFSNSGAHDREGVGKAALSAQSLISPEMRLSPADLEKIYTLP